jgi:hypothetical protein
MGLGRRAPGFCVRDDPHLGMDRKGVEQDEMSQPLVYIATSDVREGALEELKSAIGDLTDFVESHEPQIVSYAAYFSQDGSQMTVIHVHADSASLDFHMDVAGPRFARFADLVTLSSIRIFGELSPKAVKQLENKVQLLGSGEVTVHPLHAGFGRFEAH